MSNAKRVSTDLSGIDRQSSDLYVKDGAAFDIVNLRYEQGVLRLVRDGKEETRPYAFEKPDLIYVHAPLPNGDFISKHGLTISHNTYITATSKYERKPIYVLGVSEKFYTFGQFGNALLICTSANINRFIYSANSYQLVSTVQGSWKVDGAPRLNMEKPSQRLPFSFKIADGNTTLTPDVRERIATVTIKSNFEEVVEDVAIRADMKDKGKVKLHFFARMAIIMNDGSTFYASIPSYVRFGDSGVSYTEYNDYGTMYFENSTANPTGKLYLCRCNTSTARDIEDATSDITYFDLCSGYSTPYFSMQFDGELIDTLRSLKASNLAKSIGVFITRPQNIIDVSRLKGKYRTQGNLEYLDGKPYSVLADLCRMNDYDPSNQNGPRFLSVCYELPYTEVKPDETYYLLKEIEIKKLLIDMPDRTWGFSVKPSELEDVVHNKVLSADFSRHLISAACCYEYNSRLHLYETSIKLSNGDSNSISESCAVFQLPPNTNIACCSPTSLSLIEEFTITSNGKVKVVCRKAEYCFGDIYQNTAIPYFYLQNTLVCYPDYRLTRYRLLQLNHIQTRAIALLETTDITKDLKNNIAYGTLEAKGRYLYRQIKLEFPIIQPLNGAVMYAALAIFEDTKAFDYTPVFEQTLPNDNTLHVSDVNDFFNFKHSYALGTVKNRIVALQTTADQLTESRFGQFPLYVFTKEGVFALESGDGTVAYKSVNPVSPDIAISQESTTSAKGAVMFVSTRGAMAIAGREVSDLSNSIEGTAPNRALSDGMIAELCEKNGYPANITEYLKDCTTNYIYKQNEVVYFNPAFKYAYIYSLNSNSWYRRTIKGQQIIRDSSRLLEVEVANGSIIFRNLEEEPEQSSNLVNFLYVSRPIKFGSKDYKRMERAIFRLNSPDCSLGLYILGSIDDREYKTINYARLNGLVGDVLLRRVSVSVRSFIFVITGLSADIDINNVDMELFDKYEGRMR